MNALRYPFTAAVTAVSLALAPCVFAPRPAAAGDGAALLGGFAAGALVGGAIASAPRYYAPPPAVYVAPPPPPYYADCGYQRRPVYDSWGNFAGYRYMRLC